MLGVVFFSLETTDTFTMNSLPLNSANDGALSGLVRSANKYVFAQERHSVLA